MVTLLICLWTVLVGCNKPPVYQNITSVTVHTQTGMSGVTKNELAGEELQEAVECLYQTEEIREQDSSAELLQAIILLQVTDRLGNRMFELYTNKNFKGNKGKYYRNNCIYGLIRK